ncbi:MAG: citrate transporter [Oscillospiraceae bacterium]|nr:citrate transporter [Oscillospiraceae bacterium]
MSETTILSIAGFLTIAVILILLNRKWTSPYVAISMVPIIVCLLIGKGASLGEYILSGINSISQTGVMFIFSVAFFGILSETGAFDPFVNRIIKATKGDPVRLMLGVFLFASIVHLDGSGVVTCLLVVPPMLPIFKRLHMKNTSFAMALGLGAGLMNAIPWGGPTMRAASVLEMDVMELWIPFIPTQIFGTVVAAVICVMIGRKEKKRLIAEGILKENAPLNMDEFITQLTEEQMQMRRPKLIVVNWLLILLVIGLLISGIVKPLIAFMIGTAVALIINYWDPATQRKLLEDKGKDAIGLTCIIFSAGVLMGIMGKSGMSAAMATTLVKLIPNAMSKFMAPIIGVLSIPLSILFDADSYYYGILPILIETAEALGTNGVDIARASMIGQMTVGWPTSPMVGTFFLFTGLLDLDIGAWQKYCLKYFILVTVAMTVFACLTGLFVF